MEPGPAKAMRGVQEGLGDKPGGSPQPNVAVPAVAELSAKMWGMVLLTGVGAGLTSGLLMKLLRIVQHLSFAYTSGDFLDGVRQTSGERRVAVLVLGGNFAGLALYLLRRLAGSTGAEVTGAI